MIHPQLRKIVRVVGQPSFVQSYERTSIYPKMTAFIEKWNVDIGDKVRKGDVLADLFVPELREHLGDEEGDRRVRPGAGQAGPEGGGGRRRRGQGGQARLEEARSILGKYEAEVERWDVQVKRLAREVERQVVAPQILLESQNELNADIAARDAAKATIAKAEAELLADEADAGEGRGQCRGRPRRSGRRRERGEAARGMGGLPQALRALRRHHRGP